MSVPSFESRKDTDGSKPPEFTQEHFCTYCSERLDTEPCAYDPIKEGRLVDHGVCEGCKPIKPILLEQYEQIDPYIDDIIAAIAHKIVRLNEALITQDFPPDSETLRNDQVKFLNDLLDKLHKHIIEKEK